jgi:hypothetical protein
MLGPNEWTVLGLFAATNMVGFGVWMAKMYSSQQLILKRLEDGDRDMAGINETLTKHGLHLHRHDVQFERLHKGHA